MRLFSQQPVWLFLLGASPALADFQSFYFAGNGGNSSAIRKCGNMPYGCDAPSMCSQDTLTNKWYCCEPGSTDSPCWNGITKCDGTGTNEPSAQQTGCVSGTVKYCCIKDSEQCTKRANQFNICWSTQDNPIRPLNKTRINETYWSSQSANPSASSYTINQAQLFSMTSTTPGASSATPSSTSVSSSASTTPSASSTAPATNDSGLSGGAIGGIVGGIVGGLALLGALGFFLWRRRRNTGKVDPHAAPGDPYQSYGYQPGYQPQQAYSPQPGLAQPYSPPPTDKYAHQMAPVEAPADHHAVEMDASYYHQHPGK